MDLQKDVVPLLGNPFVVGAADASSFLGGSDGNGFVAAIQVSDEDKLSDLLEKHRRDREGRAVRGQDLRRRPAPSSRSTATPSCSPARASS